MMQLTVLLGMVGGWQLVVVLVVILLLFGGRKIPELMKGLGKGMKEFKDARGGDDKENSNNQQTPTTENNNNN